MSLCTPKKETSSYRKAATTPRIATKYGRRIEKSDTLRKAAITRSASKLLNLKKALSKNIRKTKPFLLNLLKNDGVSIAEPIATELGRKTKSVRKASCIKLKLSKAFSKLSSAPSNQHQTTECA